MSRQGALDHDICPADAEEFDRLLGILARGGVTAPNVRGGFGGDNHLWFVESDTQPAVEATAGEAQVEEPEVDARAGRDPYHATGPQCALIKGVATMATQAAIPRPRRAIRGAKSGRNGGGQSRLRVWMQSVSVTDCSLTH